MYMKHAKISKSLINTCKNYENKQIKKEQQK